jgi:hypothetical protein
MNDYGIVCAGVEMILHDIFLEYNAFQQYQYTGIDSPDECRDKEFFLQYPHKISYIYNSRGFRDKEWPESLEELRDAIWCIGDSFTVGLGQPYEHIWPQILSKLTSKRTINVSMDGASNDWIFRMAKKIYDEVDPRYMIVMWSYTHRREYAITTLSDEQRRLHYDYKTTSEQDLNHFMDIALELRALNKNTIECAIPFFHPEKYLPMWPWPEKSARELNQLWVDIKDTSWPRCPKTQDELDALPENIKNELRNVFRCYKDIESYLLSIAGTSVTGYISEVLEPIIMITQHLDWARDYHHFDILTAQWLVDQILKRMGVADSSKIDSLVVYDD